MKLKQFSQFIMESSSNGLIAEVLQTIASSAQDNGWNGYIGVADNAIVATESWTDDEYEYAGEEVVINIEVEFKITPIISPEYSESANLQRLLTLGMVQIDSLITGFTVESSLSASCDETSRFSYSSGEDSYTVTQNDLAGDNSTLANPEEFGKEMVATLDEWTNEFTRGGMLRAELQEILNELSSDEEDNDDY
jgi:hypothetical protein